MVEVKGKLHQIFEFKKPKNSNYIVIEVLGMPVGKNFSVVKIPDNYIIEVGRSNAELSIPDVSVSKKQATLKYDMSINELVLTDFNSKYGTHILVQRPIELQLNQPMFFMNGLSLIQIMLKSRAKRFLCCPKLKSTKAKYVQLNKCLYQDLKHQMPEDLLKLENEQNDNPHSYKLYDLDRFKKVSVHMMPLTKNSFYIKTMEQENSIEGSEDND